MRISQSTLNAWSRCPQQWRLSKTLPSAERWSFTVFGTVVHHALQILEKYRDLQKALDTFEWYWHPLHIDELTPGVTHWRAKESYGSLRERGLQMIRVYWTMQAGKKDSLLSLEHPFEVPVLGTVDRVTGQPHTLSGYVDRLGYKTVVKDRRKIVVLDVADFKTGIQAKGLRHNVQGTAYAYATTQPEFWLPFGDEADSMFQAFQDSPRHFTWVNLKEARFADGGYRGPQDYARLTLAVQQVCDSIQAEIFPLSISAATCEWCEYQNVCGGIGLPQPEHGAP
ncbi:MAG: RecB family exonuclease [Oryzihumus sp.]